MPTLRSPMRRPASPGLTRTPHSADRPIHSKVGTGTPSTPAGPDASGIAAGTAMPCGLFAIRFPLASVLDRGLVLLWNRRTAVFETCAEASGFDALHVFLQLAAADDEQLFVAFVVVFLAAPQQNRQRLGRFRLGARGILHTGENLCFGVVEIELDFFAAL